MSCDQCYMCDFLPPCSPPAHVVAPAVHCLLPVLATIPGTDHYFTPFTSHPSPSHPSHPSAFSSSLVDIDKVKEALETSLEQLPLPLPFRGADDARAGDMLDGVLSICRQLPSAEQYRAFALHTVCDYVQVSTCSHNIKQNLSMISNWPEY